MKLNTELAKTQFGFKKEANFGVSLKMKRIADKLHEVTSQMPDKKKTRLKTGKEELHFH